MLLYELGETFLAGLQQIQLPIQNPSLSIHYIGLYHVMLLYELGETFLARLQQIQLPIQNPSLSIHYITWCYSMSWGETFLEITGTALGFYLFPAYKLYRRSVRARAELMFWTPPSIHGDPKMQMTINVTLLSRATPTFTLPRNCTLFKFPMILTTLFPCPALIGLFLLRRPSIPYEQTTEY
jgi:hypothetical protein